MRLTLAVPDLLGLPPSALAIPALAKLARYAPAAQRERAGLESSLLAAAGLAADTPIAPLAALGAGFDAGSSYVLRADPIALIAGRDDVLLTGRVDDLAPDEALALIAPLNRHFAPDGLAFHAPRPDAWFVTTRGTPAIATTPLGSVRGTIYPHLPRGDDATTWRRWLSEMQMLLHEHPVNAARERAGRQQVTGIWIADGGRIAAMQRDVDVTLFAATGTAGDVVRGLAWRRGMTTLSMPTDFASLAMAQDAVVVLARVAAPGDLERIAHAWIDPALTALERGALASMTLLAEGGGATFRWDAQRPSWLARVRRRFAAPSFSVPRLDDIA